MPTLSTRVYSLKNLIRAFITHLLIVVLVLVGVHLWQTRHIASGLLPDLPVTVQKADGSVTQTTLEQWRQQQRGQAFLLHIWAEWCPICRLEEASISSLHSDIPVLTVAMQSGDLAAVEGHLRKRQLNWHTVTDPKGELARALGVQAVPTQIMVDSDGQLRAPSVGYTTEWGMRLRWWLTHR